MIAVDTSAIVAMIKEESDAPHMRELLRVSNGALMSTGNLLELQIVLVGHQGLGVWPDVEIVLRESKIVIHPFDERQLHIARDAAVRYGKGRHKAGLNFGDCFAYALAKSEGLALLCKGGDFIHTDLQLV